MPPAFSTESDLNCFAIYTRINRSVLRIHKMNVSTGELVFNIISAGELPSQGELSNKFSKLANYITSNLRKKK
jgi:hypothetical protein